VIPGCDCRDKACFRTQNRSFLSTHWCLNSEQVRLRHDAGMDHFNQVMVTVQARDLERELQDSTYCESAERGAADMELPVFDNPALQFWRTSRRRRGCPEWDTGKRRRSNHKGMFMSYQADPEYHRTARISQHTQNRVMP
jgi:hypothetical protein